MAIAGGATTAYLCQVQDGALAVDRTTTLRDRCTPAEEAVPLLAQGERVTVAGGEMARLRQLLGLSRRPEQ